MRLTDIVYGSQRGLGGWVGGWVSGWVGGVRENTADKIIEYLCLYNVVLSGTSKLPTNYTDQLGLTGGLLT